jgi:excinuclease UvrABC nuclease subunit
MTNTINWQGNSGRTYKYWIYPIDSSFKSEPGNYLFAKETSPRTWRPVYIGQAKNLDDRLDNHNKEACAKRNGATHIHAHLNHSKEARLAEESDLIKKWNPACNG